MNVTYEKALTVTLSMKALKVLLILLGQSLHYSTK